MLSAYLRSPLPAKTVKEVQRGILRPMAFRPHLMIDLAFSGRDFELLTGKRCLSGAEHIQFEVVFHGLTSWIEVEYNGGNTYDNS